MYPASTTHMQYLKDSAMIPLNRVCRDALDPKFGHVTMDASNVLEIRKIGEMMMSTDNLFDLLDLIRESVLRYVRMDFEDGERTRRFMTSMMMLYHVYCLGFVDVCCTMNGDPSVIDPNSHAPSQILDIEHSVLKYTRLSHWVTQSCVDWKKALNEISEVSNVNCMIEMVMFMTNETIE
jgi:hypothetical protein